MDRSSPHLDRGALVRSLVAGATVVGFDLQRRAWITASHDPPVMARVPTLAGKLLLDRDTRRSYVADDACLAPGAPAAVLLPACAADVAGMLRYATEMKLRVAVRGQDDRSFGCEDAQGVDRAGLLIDMATLDKVHAVDDEAMRVDAGASWAVVAEAALRHGRTPPVLTEFLEPSVGATLATGGLAASSWLHGAQVDNVIELEVATGAGELLRCSADRQRGLFDAVLGGQGQCAVITEVRLRLVRAPARVLAVSVAYADLDVLMQDLLLVRRQARFHQAFALVAPDLQGGWFYLLSLICHFDPPQRPDEASLTQGLSHVNGTLQSADMGYDQYIRRMPRTGMVGSYPVVGMVLPEATGTRYVRRALDLLLPRQDLAALLFSWDTSRFARPLLRMPPESDAVGVIMLRYAPPSRGVVERVRDLGPTLWRHGRELGGTFYPVNPVNMTRQDWVRHYGSAWPALARAKRLHDPGNVLASGPDLF